MLIGFSNFCGLAVVEILTITNINIHIGVTCHRSGLTIATAIDVTNAGERLDIYRWALTLCCRTTLQWSRIGCLITSAIELADGYEVAACLFDVYRDGATDGATDVIAAKHAVKVSVGDGQRHIALNISCLSTTVCILQSRDARHF